MIECAGHPPISGEFTVRLFFGLERLIQDVAARVSVRASDRTTAMTLDEDLLLSDELPAEARVLIDTAEQSVAAVKAKTERTVAAIRDTAERECRAITQQADSEVAAVQLAASQELSPLLRDLFHQLKDLQNRYAQAGQLDEALAIRSRLRLLRGELFGVKADPGTLTEFGTSDIGKSIIYEVVGSIDGNIWGTDAFTADSRLAVAAVHTGCLRVGERGLVRVTLIDGGSYAFEGTERHGIRSLDYNGYTVGYLVERM
jgi:hypothetical protein